MAAILLETLLFHFGVRETQRLRLPQSSCSPSQPTLSLIVMQCKRMHWIWLSIWRIYVEVPDGASFCSSNDNELRATAYVPATVESTNYMPGAGLFRTSSAARVPWFQYNYKCTRTQQGLKYSLTPLYVYRSTSNMWYVDWPHIPDSRIPTEFLESPQALGPALID